MEVEEEEREEEEEEEEEEEGAVRQRTPSRPPRVYMDHRHPGRDQFGLRAQKQVHEDPGQTEAEAEAEDTPHRELPREFHGEGPRHMKG